LNEQRKCTVCGAPVAQSWLDSCALCDQHQRDNDQLLADISAAELAAKSALSALQTAAERGRAKIVFVHNLRIKVYERRRYTR
jgi:hypothetical protein